MNSNFHFVYEKQEYHLDSCTKNNPCYTVFARETGIATQILCEKSNLKVILHGLRKTDYYHKGLVQKII